MCVCVCVCVCVKCHVIVFIPSCAIYIYACIYMIFKVVQISLASGVNLTF